MESELASLLSGMGRGGFSERDEVHLKGDAAQAWREKFQPIPNLKAGDKVRWKTGCKNAKHGDYDDVLEVFSVLPEPMTKMHDGGSNHTGDVYDFTMATWDSGKVFELYCFDSRRFERVEEVTAEATA